MRRSAVYPHILGMLTTAAVEPLMRAPYLTVAAWLRRFDAWPDERRAAWQQHRLAEVLRDAAGSVPFYRHLLPGGAHGVRLSDLPVVDKRQIRDSMDDFRSEGWQHTPHVRKSTGGTTGDAWQYELDRRAWTHVRGAQIHLWERTGYRYGDRIVLLGTPPSLLGGGSKFGSRLRTALEHRIYSAAGIEVDHLSSLERARAAVEADGVVWYGYASMIASMAEAVLDNGIRLNGPTAVITTSEPLHPVWRRRIADAFGAPVYDEYGCNDGGVIALTCPRGRFHIAENVSLVEIVEGDSPCPPGVEGDIVVTNLHARVLPFLRYRIGDRGVLAATPCPCGRAGATLESVNGRVGDRLVLPNGIQLSYVNFTTIFWGTPHVRRWQIVQEAIDRVTVRLETEPGFTTREAEQIRQAIRTRSRGQLEVDIRVGEPIERTEAGKQRVVINRLTQVGAA